MKKIWACYSIFQEGATLDASLFSISGLVDGVIIADGPYDTYSGYEMKSGEETQSIIRKWRTIFDEDYSLTFKYLETGKMNEIDKRNLMFRHIPEGDIAFVIDGDEIAFTSMNLTDMDYWDIDVAFDPVKFVEVLHLRGAWGWRPRFFRVGPKLEYKRWFEIQLNDGTILNLKDMPKLPNGDVSPSKEQKLNSIRLANLSMMFRSKERDEMGLQIKESLLKRDWK